MDKSTILQVKDLTKTFQSGGQPLTVLNSISFSLEKGTSCAMIGPSGSGKTTLLGLCAGLDRPTTGSIHLNGSNITHMSEENLAHLRNNHVGFVFQTFRLIPTLTALENVMVPLELRGGKGTGKKASVLLDRVGLKDRSHHYPSQLSGGEQQRVALARAFINTPKILFADEPTGNLDPENSEHVSNLLFDLNKESGTTLVLVTHNQELAKRAERIFRFRKGHLR